MTLLTIEETAQRLKVSYATARRMIIEGDLPAVEIRAGNRKKLLRVSEDALTNWITRGMKQYAARHHRQTGATPETTPDLASKPNTQDRESRESDEKDNDIEHLH